MQSKSVKYYQAMHNVNQLLVIALSNGEIVIRNPLGQELVKVQTDLGSDIIDIAAP